MDSRTQVETVVETLEAANRDRRDFLKQALVAAVAVPFFSITGGLSGQAAYAKENKPKEIPLPPGEEKVAADDPIALAIGYKQDVKLIDYKNYPQRKKPEAKNQFCKNCTLYTSVNEGWGKCSMLQKGVVNANGWCSSFNKKDA